ncbi:MAG TPA: MFS transporter [Patescibacteria group bacterium]|nr:MFS transporter [Patescibacteria group bacterium]
MNQSSPTVLWSRGFLLLSLSSALLFAGFHLLLPTLPLFAAAYGATTTQIGLIIGGFTFSAIGVRLFVTAGIRRWGRHRFLQRGLVICILAMSTYYFTNQAMTTLLVRLFHGVGFGIASTVFAALAIEYIPVSRRAEGMGYFGLGATLMMAVAPLIGLWFYENFQSAGLFAAATSIQLLALVILGLLPAAAPDAGVPAHRAAALSLRPFIFPCFLALLLGICLGSVMSFITLLAKERHLDNPGLFFMFSTSGVFFVRTFSGRIYDRHGAAWVIVPAAFFLSLSMYFLYSNNVSLLVAAAFYGIGLGILFPSLQTWFSQMVTLEQQTAVNALYYNTLDIGVGGGSILLGWLAQGKSYAVIYEVSFVLSLIFLGSYLAYLWRLKRLKSRQSLSQTL